LIQLQKNVDLKEKKHFIFVPGSAKKTNCCLKSFCSSKFYESVILFIHTQLERKKRKYIFYIRNEFKCWYQQNTRSFIRIRTNRPEPGCF